jgi:hypothetical protein
MYNVVVLFCQTAIISPQCLLILLKISSLCFSYHYNMYVCYSNNISMILRGQVCHACMSHTLEMLLNVFGRCLLPIK